MELWERTTKEKMATILRNYAELVESGEACARISRETEIQSIGVSSIKFGPKNTYKTVVTIEFEFEDSDDEEYE